MGRVSQKSYLNTYSGTSVEKTDFLECSAHFFSGGECEVC